MAILCYRQPVFHQPSAPSRLNFTSKTPSTIKVAYEAFKALVSHDFVELRQINCADFLNRGGEEVVMGDYGSEIPSWRKFNDIYQDADREQLMNPDPVSSLNNFRSALPAI